MPLRQDHMPKIQMPVAVAFASGVSASILAVLLLVYSFNSGPTRSAGVSAAPEKQTAENPAAPEPPRILGGTQPQDASCDNQTWPYIDQHCLTPAPPKERVASKPADENSSPTPNIDVRPGLPAPDNTVQNQPAVAPPSTDGVASASDRPALAVASVMKPASTAIPDRPIAITGEPAQKPSEPAAAPNTFAKADSKVIPASETQVSESAVKPSRKVKDSRPPRERTASVKADDPNRIVRRWREVEYRGANGEIRKVIYVQRGALQRDAYFQTLR